MESSMNGENRRERDSAPMADQAALLLCELRRRRPLVHCITNYVTVNDVANALLACGGHIVVVNVGDSRAYCLKKNVLVQATKDHSFVQFLIDNGTISPSQAENHPNKNLILRALGVNESIEADTYFIDDCVAVLLCSDGLTNCVSDEDIRRILRRKTSGEEKLRELIDAANNGGGADNITAVLYLPD